jgi:hypothetical protein
MLIVPLQAVASQAVTVSLGGQLCQLNVYQRAFGLFIDVLVNNSLIIGGVICLNQNLIVRSAYLGFIGDLAFVDTQGTTDPTYTGLGSRYQLGYLSPAEVAALPIVFKNGIS